MSDRAAAKPFCAIIVIGLSVITLIGAFSGCSTVRYEELAQEYFNLGNAYYEAGDYDRSYQYYTRALQYTDEFPAAGFNLARLHIEREEPDAALEIVDILLTEDPANTLYLETRAYALVLLGRIEEARLLYRRILAEEVMRPRVAYNLALLELDAEDPAAAFAVLQAGAPFATEDPDYIWLHAEAAFADGREDEAIARLEQFGYRVAEEPEELARLARRYAEWDFNLAALDLLDSFEPAPDDATEMVFLRGALLLQATTEFEAGLELIEGALVDGYRDSDAYRELLRALSEDEAAILLELAEQNGFQLDDGGEENSSPEDFDSENATN